MSDRLEQLRSMLSEEPGDQFLRYAIALEHKRAGNMEQAITDLESILKDDPKYVAAYYQLALIQSDLNLIEEAKQTCEAGMLQALVVGDRKARAELQEMRNTLEDAE